jgi:pimeloyl-ACP methyl ester carboxylesterase
MTPIIRSAFGTLSTVAPTLAGRAAYRLFTTPLKVGRLTAAERRLEQRAAARLAEAEDIGFTYDGRHIAAHRFEPPGGVTGQRVIMVHGWMSGARFMLAPVEPLLAAGHQVICFDLPAHGASTGRRTTIIDCARALAELLTAHPADTIIAHSFGGAVTAYALSRLVPGALGEGGRVILLASPNQLLNVTAHFSRSFGLNARAQRTYEARLASAIGEPLIVMDGNAMYSDAGVPLTIIHSADDAEVSVEEGRRFARLGNQAHLIELDGLGHRRILYHKDAVAAMCAAVAA